MVITTTQPLRFTVPGPNGEDLRFVVHGSPAAGKVRYYIDAPPQVRVERMKDAGTDARREPAKPVV